jgi:hypothetical protein
MLGLLLFSEPIQADIPSTSNVRHTVSFEPVMRAPSLTIEG